MQPIAPENNKPIQSLTRRIWDAFHRRPFTKLGALVLAIVFWAVVIASDPTLTIEKTIVDATVTVLGAEALRNRGFIVVDDLAKEPITVKMRIQVKQGDYTRATAQSFSPRLDLSQIASSGKQELKFTASSDLGKVLSIEPESIALDVDTYVPPTRVPIVVRETGEAKEPIWFDPPTVDPGQIYVSGPQALVRRVKRAVVSLPVDSLSANQANDVLALPITLEDENGVPISSSLVRITSESINIANVNLHVKVYPVREIPISVDTAYTGVPAHGYKVGSVTLSPATVEVAAPKDVLDALETLHFTSPLDISGQTVSQISTSPLRGLTGMAHVSTAEAALMVEILPATHAHTYVDIPITVMGVTNGLSPRLSKSMMNVVISGEYPSVESLKAEDLHLYVDASYLEEGEHVVNVKLQVDGTEAYEFELEEPQITLMLVKSGI